MSEKKSWIVETSEIKDGQEISSGGIRKNGKMQEMFSNPRPYDPEPKHSQMVKRVSSDSTKSVTTKRSIDTGAPQRQTSLVAESMKSFAGDCLIDIFYMLWDIGKPILRNKAKAFIEKMSSAPSKPERLTKAEELMKKHRIKAVSEKTSIDANVIPITRYRAQ